MSRSPGARRGGGRNNDSRSPVQRGGRGGGGGGGPRPNEPNKLFIGQLSFEAEEDEIRDKFSKVGEVVQVQIIRDRDTGKSKGFGFVKYADQRDAEEALRTMDHTDIAGRPCRVDRAGGGKKTDDGGGGRGRDSGRDGWYDRGGGGGRDRGGGGGGGGGGRGGGGGKGGSEPDKLFIGRLSPDVVEDDIRDKFGKVGEIVQVQIIKDRETGDSKGFGFIKFARPEDADDVLRKLNDTEILGRQIRLERVGGPKREGGRSPSPRSASPSQRRQRYGQARQRESSSRSRSPMGRAGRPPPNGARDGRREGGDWQEGGRPRRRDDFERDYGGGREYDRGPPMREPRGARRPRPDSREPPPPRRERRRSPSGPTGVPSKSEAIRSARVGFEDAQDIYYRAAEKAAIAEEKYKKIEKTVQGEAQRHVAEVSKSVKAKLEDNLAALKAKSKKSLTEALRDAEEDLKRNLQEKIVSLKQEYETKIDEEQQRVKNEHKEQVAQVEKKLTDEADAKIKDLQEKAEKEEDLRKYEDEHDKAQGILEDEEDKLLMAKKKLESLTGQKVVVKEPRHARGAAPPPQKAARRNPPEPRQGHYDRPRDGRDGPDGAYSDYTEYSDEFEQPDVARKPSWKQHAKY